MTIANGDCCISAGGGDAAVCGCSCDEGEIDVLQHQPQKQSQDQPQHQVQFNLQGTEEILVERIVDFTPEERASKWYTSEDYGVLWSQNSLTAKLMIIGRQNPEQLGYCYRGLEHYEPMQQRRDRATRRACKAVLEEQARQRNEMGRGDPELLATVYKGYTLVAIGTACRAARKDASDARVYHLEPTAPPERRQSISSTSDPLRKYSVVVGGQDEISVLSEQSYGYRDQNEDERADRQATAPDRTNCESKKGLMGRIQRLFKPQRRNSLPMNVSDAADQHAASHQPCRRNSLTMVKQHKQNNRDQPRDNITKQRRRSSLTMNTRYAPEPKLPTGPLKNRQKSSLSTTSSPWDRPVTPPRPRGAPRTRPGRRHSCIM